MSKYQRKLDLKVVGDTKLDNGWPIKKVCWIATKF